MGFLGVNGGSHSALAGAVDALTTSDVIVNTNLAAAGVIVALTLLTRKVIDWTIGARIGPDVEAMGQDVAELGIEAFPEFVPAMED